ncbi:MAG: hypothetical protein ACYTBZ_17465, partial [Planctomycetota bacterium]
MSREEYTSKLPLWVSLILAIAITQTATAAYSGVGELQGALPGGPNGSFSIRISQGGTDIVNVASVALPQNLNFHLWNSDDYVVLKTLGAGTADETDIILKALSLGGPVTTYRRTEWYIAAIKPGQLNSVGNISLFDPSNSDRIEVEIGNIEFVNMLTVTPKVDDLVGFYASYMRDSLGSFYYFDDARDYNQDGNALWDVQVRGNTYNDGNTNDYDFTAAADQSSPV